MPEPPPEPPVLVVVEPQLDELTMRCAAEVEAVLVVE